MSSKQKVKENEKKETHEVPELDVKSSEPKLSHANNDASTGNDVVDSNLLTEDEKLKQELDAQLEKDLENEGVEDESEDTISLNLKVKNKHPNGRYNLLDLVVVGHEFKLYKINKGQFEDLLTEGSSAWIECQEHPDLVALKKQYELEKR